MSGLLKAARRVGAELRASTGWMGVKQAGMAPLGEALHGLCDELDVAEASARVELNDWQLVCAERDAARAEATRLAVRLSLESEADLRAKAASWERAAETHEGTIADLRTQLTPMACGHLLRDMYPGGRPYCAACHDQEELDRATERVDRALVELSGRAATIDDLRAQLAARAPASAGLREAAASHLAAFDARRAGREVTTEAVVATREALRAALDREPAFGPADRAPQGMEFQCAACERRGGPTGADVKHAADCPALDREPAPDAKPEPAPTLCGNEPFPTEFPCVREAGHTEKHKDAKGLTWGWVAARKEDAPVATPKPRGPRARLRALRDATIEHAESLVSPLDDIADPVTFDRLARLALDLTVALAASRPTRRPVDVCASRRLKAKNPDAWSAHPCGSCGANPGEPCR